MANARQLDNIARFERKIPANAKSATAIRALPNGSLAIQARSPGRASGSFAVYEKQMDVGGKTVQYTKTTYDASGRIINVKDKMNGGVF